MKNSVDPKITDGKIHARISLILAIPTAIVLWLIAMRLNRDAFLWFGLGLGGLLFSVICSPDLDQAMMTNSEWAPIKMGHAIIPVVGALPGVVWTMAWIPYAVYIGGSIGYRSTLLRRVFKHRGISHWPIVGTATRLLYLYGVCQGLLWVFAPQMHSLWRYLPAGESICFVSALLVGDLGHLARDLWGLGGKIPGKPARPSRKLSHG